MHKWLIAFFCLTVFAGCKTYEQHGGVRWNSSFATLDNKFPLETFATKSSDDSALLVIQLLGHEKSKNVQWKDSVSFYFQVFTDTSRGDKFNFNDSTSIIIPNRTISTNNNEIIKTWFNPKKIKSLLIYVRSSEMNYKRMVEISTQTSLTPIMRDSSGTIVNPVTLRTNISYNIHNPSQHFFKVQHYPFPRTPASPAYRNNDLSSTHLLSDTSFTNNGNISFDTPGAYRFTDSLANNSFTVLVHEGYFPKIKMSKDLVRPLRYITKNEEYTKLMNATNQKQEVDSFWLAKSKSELVARKSIRIFYNRVEEANRLFTTYIPGWMTDRGMILIMYGPPDRSYKFKEGEIWSYSRNFTRAIEMVFVRKESFLGTEHELRRNQEFLPSWNQQSFKWRSGGILNDAQDL